VSEEEDVRNKVARVPVKVFLDVPICGVCGGQMYASGSQTKNGEFLHRCHGVGGQECRNVTWYPKRLPAPYYEFIQEGQPSEKSRPNSRGKRRGKLKSV
jgi:hypothetical protein